MSLANLPGKFAGGISGYVVEATSYSAFFTMSALTVVPTLLLLAWLWPRIGDRQHDWINGLYDCLCVIVVFPIIVAIGAGEMRVDGPSIRIARFFGDLSYPLYITHYPLIYIYTAWAGQNRVTPTQAIIWGAVLFFAAVALAWACLKLYDEPVRHWLTQKLQTKRA